MLSPDGLNTGELWSKRLVTRFSPRAIAEAASMAREVSD
jgi:hypothetical protein